MTQSFKRSLFGTSALLETRGGWTNSSSSSVELRGSAGRVYQARGDEDDEIAFDVLVDVGPESRPTSGMSPMIGVRSSVFCTSSRIKPPSTTVWPSQTLTLVVTLRELKMGWLITFGVSTEAGEV